MAITPNLSIDNNNQKQKAGDNSLQIQADLIVVNQGIDEKRAREILMEIKTISN